MLGRDETDALAAADRCDLRTLETIIAELDEPRLRGFIRALERAHDHAVRELSERHGDAPYSGMGGLLLRETDAGRDIAVFLDLPDRTHGD